MGCQVGCPWGQPPCNLQTFYCYLRSSLYFCTTILSFCRILRSTLYFLLRYHCFGDCLSRSWGTLKKVMLIWSDIVWLKNQESKSVEQANVQSPTLGILKLSQSNLKSENSEEFKEDQTFSKTQDYFRLWSNPPQCGRRLCPRVLSRRLKLTWRPRRRRRREPSLTR